MVSIPPFLASLSHVFLFIMFIFGGRGVYNLSGMGLIASQIKNPICLVYVPTKQGVLWCRCW